MSKAIELLQQGRYEEIWQMCCGYLHLNTEQFLDIQNRLLLNQIESLNRSKIGRKIMNGAVIQTVEDFRREVPLTTYKNYCPELSRKEENVLPEKPVEWVHTSGRSGEYPCKWIPVTSSYIQELGPILYGVGLLSASRKWGDTSPLVKCPRFIYSVAPRPYISGALASILRDQTPSRYYPSLEKAEFLPFEDRIKLGFQEALSAGLDYFFGLSIVLTMIGDKFSQASSDLDILALLSKPKAMMRLTKGLISSRMAKRKLLPRDLWHVKGIISSGLDSSVFKEKIKEYWGRYPLDIYASTEGGVIATQTWDYGSMTFIPNLNFLEFIPEKEIFKWQLDPNYQPETVLLNEVKAGECYEAVITNFHGGALIRYRTGDIIRITSLRNENTGVDIPQMVFERRADDLIDLVVLRLTEKTIWNAIENTGIPYENWVAFRTPGERALNILIEPKATSKINEFEFAQAIHTQLLKADDEAFNYSRAHRDEIDSAGLTTRVKLLPLGTFANYIAQRRAEGADIAHLKPPHVNPSQKVLSTLLNTAGMSPEPEIIIRAREKLVSVR